MLAVAILLAAAALLYVGVVTPVLDLYAEREARLANDRMLAPRLRTAAAQVPQLQARVADLRRTARARRIVLEGATDALAAANLQTSLEGLAAAAGATLGSIEGVAAEARGGYRRIGLHVAVNGTYEAIVKLLAAIDTADPPLVIDSLQIHGKPRVTVAAGAQLDAGFVLYGLRRGDGGETGDRSDAHSDTAAASKP